MRQEKKAKIGLFGGTFNPIHIGHIKMAKAALRKFKLDKIYFIPNGVPPHKQKDKLYPAKLRYKLVKKIVDKLNSELRAQNPEPRRKKSFEVLDIEINKKTKCYTIDTVKKINSQLSALSSQLFFLIGQDEFEKLHTWKKANELARLVTFIVLPRSTKQEARSRRREITRKVKNLKWHMLKTKPIDISGTEIRKNCCMRCP